MPEDDEKILTKYARGDGKIVFAWVRYSGVPPRLVPTGDLVTPAEAAALVPPGWILQSDTSGTAALYAEPASTPDPYEALASTPDPYEALASRIWARVYPERTPWNQLDVDSKREWTRFAWAAVREYREHKYDFPEDSDA